MNTVEFLAKRVVRIAPGADVMDIALRMTEEQMFAAMDEFLRHISAAAFHEWAQKVEVAA